MLNLNCYEQNILSIEENSEIMLEVHGESKCYRPIMENYIR